jgi:hypothetical protein
MSNLTLQDITKAGRDPTKAVMVTSRAGVVQLVDINLITIFGWAEILSENRALIVDNESNPRGNTSVEVELLTKALHIAAAMLSVSPDYNDMDSMQCYTMLIGLVVSESNL